MVRLSSLLADADAEALEEEGRIILYEDRKSMVKRKAQKRRWKRKKRVMMRIDKNEIERMKRERNKE